MGLYLISSEGIIIESTHSSVIGMNISDKNKFHDILDMKKPFITQYLDKSDQSSEYKGKTVFCIPIMNDKKEVKSMLIAALNMKDIVENKLQLGFDQKDVLLLNELGISFYGNDELKNEKHIYRQKIMNDKLELLFRIPKMPLTSVVVPIIFTYVITFIFFHMVYFYFSAKDLKEKEKVKQLQIMQTFAASTAHEIRNPLTALKGFVALMQKKHKDEEDKYYFKIMHEEMDRITELTSDFMYLGKPLTIEKKRFVLQENLRHTISLLENEAVKKQVKIYPKIEKEDIWFIGDYKHINQVLLNIGKNAIEASQNGGIVEIVVKRIKNKILSIKIKDNGQGIKNEDLNKLFTPFHTTKESGTGLGLMVCQKIVNSYGGTIDIKSRYKIGTKVTIELPLQTTDDN